jgi:hypothetical protein
MDVAAALETAHQLVERDALVAVADDHQTPLFVEQRRHRSHQRGLVFLRRQPPDRADHPGVARDAQLVADSPAHAGSEGESRHVDAIGNHVQARVVTVVMLSREGRGRRRDGDIGVHELRRGAAQPEPPEPIGIAPVFGVDQDGTGELARRSAVDQRLRIVRVHDIHAFAREQSAEAKRQGDVEAALLGHRQRLHSGFEERLRERTLGRRRERYRHHLVSGRALRPRQIDSHSLLSTQSERRQDVRDVHHCHLPAPRIMTNGVFTMIDSSNTRNVQNFSSAET